MRTFGFDNLPQTSTFITTKVQKIRSKSIVVVDESDIKILLRKDKRYVV
jgi:hypothetical protein